MEQKANAKDNRKYAVITGISGGMGWETARKMMQNGYHVFGIDIRMPEQDLSQIDFVQADLTDPDSVQKAFQSVREKTDRIDTLIHMAGIYELHSLVEMSEAAFERVFRVNVFSAFYINRTFLPLLKPGSRIILTSSELAPLSPLPFTGIYGISKTTIERYAFSLRRELQLLGIRVIVIRPGAVDTGLLDVSQKKLAAFCEETSHYTYNAKRFQRIVDRVEARKISPERIAALALKASSVPHPKLVYKVNRNPLLLLMNALPERLQDLILKMILHA